MKLYQPIQNQNPIHGNLKESNKREANGMNIQTTHTLTLTADEAWYLAQHCADSASYWDQLAQDVIDGKRNDLFLDSCKSISNRARNNYKMIMAMCDTD